MSDFYRSIAFPLAVVVMVLGLATIGFGIYTLPDRLVPPLGGVTQGNEYNYTQLTGPIATTTLIVRKPGAVLGSVVITEDQAGAVVLYDATSTTAYSKTNGTRIADFQTAQSEGTYVFDAVLKKGLVLESADGFLFAGDWSILWR